MAIAEYTLEFEEESMLDARRRPEGRFFYWLLSAFVVLVLAWSGVLAPVVMAAVPATTRISDVVYRADGSVASGVVLISWSAFTAADGTPVAAGSTSVALGREGTHISKNNLLQGDPDVSIQFRGAFALLGMAAQAVQETGDAAAANDINIVLDQQLVADIKALIQAVEKYAQSAGVPKPTPAK